MKRSWVIHPFLFATFPVLSLLSTHVGQVPLEDAYRPLGLALATVTVLGLALWPIVRNPQKRGLAISALMFAFFAYGPIIDGVRRALGHKVTLGTLPLSVLATLALLGGGYALHRLNQTRRDLTRLTTYLNRTALVAVLIPIGIVAFALARHAHHAARPSQTAASPSGVAPGNAAPDVYYIILDAYARADILKELYNYDNDTFLNELGRRGFYVARKSFSNYGLTYLSLSSSLNLDYLDALARENRNSTDFFANVQEQCRRSRVAAFLREHGYTFLTFASGYTATSRIDADITLSPPLVFTELDNALLNMTPIRTVLGRTAGPSPYAIHRNRILFILDRLSQVKHYGRPLFAFAHIEAPHPPYVFDADGSPVQPDRPFEVTDGQRFYQAGGTREEYISGYTRQLTYLNRRVLQTIDRILKRDPNSVIILQGDHGSRLRATNSAQTTYAKETAAILSAYYLPNRKAEGRLYDTISPVNTFRVIFDLYFGERYELLPDRSFCIVSRPLWKVSINRAATFISLIARPGSA